MQPEKTGSYKHLKPYEWKIGDNAMPVVETATHLGIVRGASIKRTEIETVKQNISKAQRATYSLMPVGLHGLNGLDPETSLHLIRIYIYITPVLTYGLEIILPSCKGLQSLEMCQKKLLNRILSLPKNTPDPAFYVLTGFIPVEGQVDLKILTFFNNICRQTDDSLEKRIAYRQLTVKDSNSCSWLVGLRRILHKYNLPGPMALLDNPVSKINWKRQIKERVHQYWRNRIINDCQLYSSLNYL